MKTHVPLVAIAPATALWLAFAAAGVVRAQSVIRLGNEFQVNSYTTGNQYGSGLNVDSNGDFVVAWQSSLQDGNGYGVFARRFSAAGVRQAAEFQVSTYTFGSQKDPAVGMRANGDFVVVWESIPQDGNLLGVFARRFNSLGAAQSVEFQVNSYTSGNQFSPAVAMDGDGDFVVVWKSDLQDGAEGGIFGRRFNALGFAQATEFRVNTQTAGNQRLPAVAVDLSGDFVVTWDGNASGNGSYDVSGQRFSASATPVGVEFLINSYVTGSKLAPSVGMDDDGDFAVVWHSGSQDGSDDGVFARRFNAQGVAQGVEFQVSTYTLDEQGLASLDMEGDGDFVISWQSSSDGDTYGTFARRFNAAGVPQGAELQVNTYTLGNQYLSVVGVDADGDFVVAWRSFGQDGSSYGVFAQRFATLSPLDVDGDGNVAPLTDGLLTLRWEFGFSGATLVTGAIDFDGCTRCNAAAIEAYLFGLK